MCVCVCVLTGDAVDKPVMRQNISNDEKSNGWKLGIKWISDLEKHEGDIRISGVYV